MSVLLEIVKATIRDAVYLENTAADHYNSNGSCRHEGDTMGPSPLPPARGRRRRKVEAMGKSRFVAGLVVSLLVFKVIAKRDWLDDLLRNSSSSCCRGSLRQNIISHSHISQSVKYLVSCVSLACFCVLTAADALGECADDRLEKASANIIQQHCKDGM